MRHKLTTLAVLLLTLCLGVQAYAAPAGFVEHKAPGLVISLPSEWKVLSKQELTKIQPKAGPSKLILAATAQANLPKLTAMDQKQNVMTQEQFEGLPDDQVAKMCTEFANNIKSRMPNAKDIQCNRQKSAKGSALVVTMNLPGPGDGVANTSWTFYRGATTTVVSGMSQVGDAAQAKQVSEALQSVQLKGK